jgi:hypothetical protein
MTGKTGRLLPEEKKEARKAKLATRFKFEAKRQRGYEMIFPSADKERNAMYEVLLQKSNEIWDGFTFGKKEKSTKDA